MSLTNKYSQYVNKCSFYKLFTDYAVMESLWIYIYFNQIFIVEYVWIFRKATGKYNTEGFLTPSSGSPCTVNVSNHQTASHSWDTSSGIPPLASFQIADFFSFSTSLVFVPGFYSKRDITFSHGIYLDVTSSAKWQLLRLSSFGVILAVLRILICSVWLE